MSGNNHPKGWKHQHRQGYVKSHNAVRNGASRDPVRADVTPLSEAGLIERGWMPAPKDELPEQLQNFCQALRDVSDRTVYLPPVVKADGAVDNISQFKVEASGPEQGHWSTVNGQRKWFKGQHNYNRQQNPRSHEHVNQTNVMNRNCRLEKLGDKRYDETTGRTYVLASKEIEPEARIVRYGRVVNVKKAPGCAAERAVERAMKHIQNKTANFLLAATPNLAADNSIVESQVQSAAGNSISPVGIEAHVK